MVTLEQLQDAKRVAWVEREPNGSTTIVEARREARGERFTSPTPNFRNMFTFGEQWLVDAQGSGYITVLTVLEEFPEPTVAEQLREATLVLFRNSEYSPRLAFRRTDYGTWRYYAALDSDTLSGARFTTELADTIVRSGHGFEVIR